MRSKPLIALALFGLALAFAPAANAARFEVTNLGILPGGTDSYAQGLSDTGHVVGGSAGYTYIWRPGTGMQKVDVLHPDFEYAGPDINSSDLVALTGPHPDIDADGFLWHGFLWASGAATDLGSAGEAICVGEGCDVDPNDQSFANGINNFGTVVGSSTIDGSAGPGVMAPTIWSGGANPVRLPGSGGGRAREIADNGRIVGTRGNRGALWEDSGADPVDLGLLPGSTGTLSDAYDLNEAGTVVGSSEISAGVTRAFVWTPGAGMQPIANPNTLGGFSSANAIGPDGTIVGSTFNGSKAVGFIREPGKPIVDLNTLIPAGTGWDLGGARDINSEGQIVGNGVLNGQPRAYLLSPTQPLTAALEPITVGSNDVFDLRMTVEHLGGTGTTKISNMTYPPAPGLVLRTVPVLGGPAPTLTRIFGPTGTFPSSLNPGQKSEHVFAYAIDSPGNGLLQTRVRGTDQEGNQYDASAALLIESELRLPDRQSLDAMVAGALLKLGDLAYQKRKEIFNKLLGVIKKRLKGTPGSMRRPTQYERMIAGAAGLPPSALSAMSNNRKRQNGKPSRMDETAAFFGAISREMLKVGDEAVDRTFRVPFSYWNDWLFSPDENKGRMAMEMAATIGEGVEGAGGLIGGAADFYTSPSQWKATWDDIPEMYNESATALKKLDVNLSKAILDWDDLMKKDPVKGMDQLGGLIGKIEGEIAVGWLEDLTGGNAVKGLAIVRDSRIAGKVATETAEVATSGGRLTGAGAKALENAPSLGNLSNKQISRFQKIVKDVNEKFGVNIELQARPINEYAAKVKGGIGKVEAVPTKNLTPDDVRLGAPEGWVGQAAYYPPKLPKNFAKLDPAEKARLQLRFDEKMKEFKQFKGLIDDPSGKTAKVHKALKKETEFTLGKNGKLKMELEATTHKSGAVLISYKKLSVNGKPVFTGKPRPIISDVDMNAVIDAATGRHLPAGIRGQVELEVMRQFAKAAEEGVFPFGYHGWTHSGFDIGAADFRHILKYQLMYMNEADAVKLAKKYAAIYGIDPSEFLDGYTRGKLLVKITATNAVLGPGAGL